jgi:hypothetical protein
VDEPNPYITGINPVGTIMLCSCGGIWRKMGVAKYTKENLEPIVKDSKTLASVAKKLGLSSTTSIIKACERLGISLKHFAHTKYTRDELEKAVSASNSIRQVLLKLELNATGGGSYLSIRTNIAKYKLDTSHFTGKLWSKGKALSSKRPIEYYLVEDCPVYISSHRLKLRLIKEGIFEQRCNVCGLEKWMGKDIPLELEHKNGKHSDCRLENLEIICPNCHAQTETYCGKNIKRNKMRD